MARGELPGPDLMKEGLETIADEMSRTYGRVREGELQPMVDNSLPIRLALLVEELGEIAELVKVVEEKKPKSYLNRLDSIQLKSAIQVELAQVAAISVDWMTCEGFPFRDGRTPAIAAFS